MNIQLGMAVLIYVLINIVLVWGKEKTSRLQMIMAIYTYLLFIICPLAFSPAEKYFNIDLVKINFFVTFSAGLFFSVIAYFIWTRPQKTKQISFSMTEKMALLYVVFSFLAFILSGDLRSSLFGPEGWGTGFLLQVFLVFLLIMTARFSRFDSRILYGILITGSVIFLLGILNRFSIDPLGFYDGVDPNGQIRFLSTIGQATWYSSYLCLLFPLGIFLFTKASNTRDKLLAAVFMALSSMSLVTQNSDSAYVAAFIEFVVITGMYLVVFMKVRELGVSYVIISLSVIFIGIMEKIFPYRFHNIDHLSVWAAQGPLPYALLAFGAFLYLFSDKLKEKRKQLGIALLTIAILALAAVVAIATAKTTMLSGYLTFDDAWGNGRGLILKRVSQMYGDLPLFKKIIGIGPGMLSAYTSKYTELILHTAHNEWLTVLIESGIGGGIAYLLIFVLSVFTGIKGALKGESLEKSLLLTALSAAIAGYVGHEIFCYQQFLTTPMVFILMGYSLGASDKIN